MTIEKSINHIYNTKKGTLDSLIKTIGPENVKSLELAGYIKRGQEVSKKNSWAITKSTTKMMESMVEKSSKNPFVFILDTLNSLLTMNYSKTHTA